MKFEYRITKYNPKYRASDGVYKRKEWTSISDIGREIGNRILKKAEYLQVESAYVKAVSMIMEDVNLRHLKILGLERGQKYGLREGQNCKPDVVKRIVQSNLREKYWCILHFNRRMFVHFGYDFYMYIGVSRENQLVLDSIRKMGLYVEKLRSPYGETQKNISRRNRYKSINKI